MLRNTTQLILINILALAAYAPNAMANDPFAELEEAASSFENGSAQWQQQRAADSFREMERSENKQQPRRQAPPPVQQKATAPVSTPKIRQASTPAPPQKTVSSPGPILTGGQTIRTRDFIFELAGCNKVDSEVSCNLFITSNKNDKVLHLYNKTRLFDDVGNEYKPSLIKIANSTNRKRLKKQLVADVKTKATLVFRDVATDATKATKLDIKAHGSNEYFNVTYRNFALASD